MKFSLINKNLPDASFDVLKSALYERLQKRNADIADNGDTVLSLAIDPSMEADSYKIYENEGITYIEANDLCTVFAGVGRYFVKGTFDQRGGFRPAKLPISHKMNNSMRGMYLASHFYNFYHAAPVEEVYDKIVDLAFRGCNCLMLCFGVQHYTGTKEPAAVEFIGRMKLMLKFADKCGIAPALILFSNTGFKDSYYGIEAQMELDGTGNYDKPHLAEFTTEICPSTEAGWAEIERQQREFFEAFADTPIKYFALWAYDEGGCLCEKCYPWVTNGFMKVADLCRKLIDEYGYNAEIIISTWHFGIRKYTEWEIFYEELRKGTYSWSPYIMTDFRPRGRMNKVFVENGIPEGVHLIDFPEISMCSAKPWGGFGANPITMLLDNIYQNCGQYHDGGFPYSEGIYEDINKWVCLGFYTGHYKHSADAVRDYIRYEFGIEDTDELLRAVQLMESSLPRGTERTDETGKFVVTNGVEGRIEDQTYRFPIRWGTAIPETYRIITEWDKKLPEKLRTDWKWRLFVIRATLDRELLNNGYITRYSEVAQDAYRELYKITHTENAKFCVHPPKGL